MDSYMLVSTQFEHKTVTNRSSPRGEDLNRLLCSFYLNLCDLEFSFPPVFLFVHSQISLILLFTDRFQYWSCVKLLLMKIIASDL